MTRMSFGALCCAVLVLSSCATRLPSRSARYWQLKECAQASSPSVRFLRPDGSSTVTVPRETCTRLQSAANKIQTVAGYELSQVLIADVKEPNAFATLDKNGTPVAVVTLGMVSALGPDEDAWAGLMGHEIAHHVKHHSDTRRS